MLSYDEIVKSINGFILYKITFNPLLGRKRFKTKSYAKWAMFEILSMVKEEKEVYGYEIDIFETIEDFIHDMDRLLGIKFIYGFNAARRTAIEFRQYLLDEKGDI